MAGFHRETKKKNRFERALQTNKHTNIQTDRQTESTTKNSRLLAGAESICDTTSVMPAITGRVHSVSWYHRFDGTMWLASSCKCCNLQLASCWKRFNCHRIVVNGILRMLLYQRLSRFSQDFDACARLVPTRSSFSSTRFRALVRHPAVWSLLAVVRPGNDRSRCLWWRRCRSELRRICLRIPTSRSSTLWLSIADTSVYLQPWSLASVLPSTQYHRFTVRRSINESMDQ